MPSLLQQVLHYQSFHRRGASAFFEACVRGDVEIAEQLLTAAGWLPSADLTRLLVTRGPGGHLPLHAAMGALGAVCDPRNLAHRIAAHEHGRSSKKGKRSEIPQRLVGHRRRLLLRLIPLYAEVAKARLVPALEPPPSLHLGKWTVLSSAHTAAASQLLLSLKPVPASQVSWMHASNGAVPLTASMVSRMPLDTLRAVLAAPNAATVCGDAAHVLRHTLVRRVDLDGDLWRDCIAAVAAAVESPSPMLLAWVEAAKHAPAFGAMLPVVAWVGGVAADLHRTRMVLGLHYSMGGEAEVWEAGAVAMAAAYACSVSRDLSSYKRASLICKLAREGIADVRAAVAAMQVVHDSLPAANAASARVSSGHPPRCFRIVKV